MRYPLGCESYPAANAAAVYGVNTTAHALAAAVSAVNLAVNPAAPWSHVPRAEVEDRQSCLSGSPAE
jgi:hypothetical protein